MVIQNGLNCTPHKDNGETLYLYIHARAVC
nr:MAG TPA: hypothetical protein [Caudoviricetes sp.]